MNVCFSAKVPLCLAKTHRENITRLSRDDGQVFKDIFNDKIHLNLGVSGISTFISGSHIIMEVLVGRVL